MTAIVAVHTVDGFAMGADGRRFDSKTNALETDEAQKVFLFDSETTRLAYAWAGVTQTSNKDGLLYDLLAASQEILPVAAKSGRDNFAFFVSGFCAALSTKLPTYMINLPKDELARGIFVGFFQGKPFSVQLQILYPCTTLLVLSEVHIPADYHKSVFSGAESIYPKYETLKPKSGADAIDFIHKYIQECVDSSNPDCAGIGGHIHIAEIKPDQSRWIIEPIGK